MRPEFEHGKCKGHADLFFLSLPYTSEQRQKEKDAKALCKECVHLKECAEYAIRHEEWGIWGGLTEKDRRKARWKRNIQLDRPERSIIDENRKENRRVTFGRKSAEKEQVSQ